MTDQPSTQEPNAGRAVAGQALRLERWFCPDCERLLKRPPYRDGTSRVHSYRCKDPMVNAIVYITERR